jgi:transposase-like protein
MGRGGKLEGVKIPMTSTPDIQAIKEFIRLHSKRCPYCQSTEATTMDAFEEDTTKMHHRCCDCGKAFVDADALSSIAAEEAAKQLAETRKEK